MSSRLFDTNILIDYLAGNVEALAAIDACESPIISKIVYMEVMVGCKHSTLVQAAHPQDYKRTLAAVEAMTRSWIHSTFKVLPIDEPTAEVSIEVRKQTNRKLPDTVIQATAILNDCDIVTRNPDDFPALAQVPIGCRNVDVIVPYVL